MSKLFLQRISKGHAEISKSFDSIDTASDLIDSDTNIARLVIYYSFN